MRSEAKWVDGGTVGAEEGLSHLDLTLLECRPGILKSNEWAREQQGHACCGQRRTKPTTGPATLGRANYSLPFTLATERLIRI